MVPIRSRLADWPKLAERPKRTAEIHNGPYLVPLKKHARFSAAAYLVGVYSRM